MKKIILLFFSFVVVWAKYPSTNALIKEQSPYLQQHAHNPVNWYPWGEEAFAKAQKENKLIFLSIGYSTCHWCHVMEEESFVDEEVARLLNKDFISMKVDREAYPQIDKKYQKLYRQVRGKRGGWPLSVFMSSKKEVFHISTYIAKETGYGSEGLLEMLPSFIKLQQNTVNFSKSIQKYAYVTKQNRLKNKASKTFRKKVFTKITKQYDKKYGGFASRPKFPEASKLALLLDMYSLDGNLEASEMVKYTLNAMARGGMYDQIGGGFFRYTIDEAWLHPHFEKMLYTNAELIPLYVKLYEMTKKPWYKKVVDETITQIEKNFMYDGSYYSATDADSAGEEGGYFIYEYFDIKDALEKKGWQTQEIEACLAYLGIEEYGNVDGEFSLAHITSDVVPHRIDAFKRYLKKVSDARPFPFIDKKINTAWNAMMVKALFSASRIDKIYLPLANKRLRTLLQRMYKNGILYHQTLLTNQPTQKAILEDYAFLIDALLTAYNRTYEHQYLQWLETFSKEAINKFYRQKQWYLSDDGVKVLADFDDRYYNAPLSQMLENLLSVASLTDRWEYKEIVEETLAHSAGILETNPQESSTLVSVYLRLKKGTIVIHASKKKLLLVQDKLDAIAYPFISSKVQESDEYLACKTTMCFAHDKNITKLIEKIQKDVSNVSNE